ncbi:MAG: tyrosine-type recombinase/integrase [Anaerolineales bacterium]|nr:tyrosine-type recombinase/integrase [Anaerolineales bacterium]
MDQYLTQFLEGLREQRRYADNTIAAYTNDLRQFWAYLSVAQGGPVSWAAVKPDLLAGYVSGLQSGSQALAASTVARRIAAVKAYFAHLTARGVIPADPAKQLAAPKIQKVAPKALGPEEIERLLAAPGRSGSAKSLRDRALLELLYATGMRVSEITQLQLEDVDWEAGAITCPGRGERQRRLPLGFAAEPLAEYLHRGRPTFLREASPATLFLNQRGQRLTRQGIWLILREAATAAGLSAVTPHTLRHSFARQQVRAGAGLRQVQKLLGHANLSTTQMYQPAAAVPADPAAGEG